MLRDLLEFYYFNCGYQESAERYVERTRNAYAEVEVGRNFAARPGPAQIRSHAARPVGPAHGISGPRKRIKDPI